MAWRSSVTLQDSSGRAEGQKPDFSGLRINGQWKKQKMDICNNMDWTSKSKEINWKNTYYMTAFGWNIWSDQTNLWWQQAGQCLSGKGDWLQRGTRELFGAVEMFYGFIEVVITQVHSFVIIHWPVYLKRGIFIIYINISSNLCLKECRKWK